MGKQIPQAFIDELINRVDIVEVINSRVPLRKAGQNYSARCPFHTERTPSFTVSPSKQFYHCFGCGAHGTAISFLMEQERMTFPEAVAELASMAGLPLPEEAQQTEPNDHAQLYEVLQTAAQFYQAQLRQHPPAIDYLKNRGMSGRTAADFGLGYAPAQWDALKLHFPQRQNLQALLIKAGLLIQSEKDPARTYDRFRDRIMFPIRDHRGRVIGFGGRGLTDAKPKYLNSPETPLFHKGQELYGLYEMRRHQSEPSSLLVVEGYMDTLSLVEQGIRNVVATLGTATTATHLQRLFRISPDIIFCFDGDQAGRVAAWRALETALPAMVDGHQVYFLFLPEGEDPDSLVRREGAQAMLAKIQQALPLSKVLLNHLRSQADTSTIDGRARLLELAKPLLKKVPPGAFRLLLAEELAKETHLEAARLTDHLELKPKRSITKKSMPKMRLTTAQRLLVMLLQNPGVALMVQQIRGLHEDDRQEVKLLASMIELAQHRPHLSMAALIESCRESDEVFTNLSALARVELTLATEDMEKEFLDGVMLLQSQQIDQRIDLLLRKAQSAPLSVVEKDELRHLLSSKASRHQGSTAKTDS